MLMANPEAECTVCGKAFMRFLTTQSVCGLRCAKRVPVLARKAARVAQKAEIQARKVTRAQRDDVKPRGKWMAEAQAAFNGWVRARDAALPCISCQRHHDGQYHAGHYLSTGARPELRFDERNLHKQCQPCNTHLHGNLILYRVNLIKKIGLAAVEALEGPHEPKKYTIPELRAIRDDYRARLKAMK